MHIKMIVIIYLSMLFCIPAQEISDEFPSDVKKAVEIEKRSAPTTRIPQHSIEDCTTYSNNVVLTWDQPRRYCGSFLARAMAQICRSRYNNENGVFMKTANVIRNKRAARPKSRITDECCAKCCTARWLKRAYCNDTIVDERKYIYVPSQLEELTYDPNNAPNVVLL